jgi:hypothetical protein
MSPKHKAKISEGLRKAHRRARREMRMGMRTSYHNKRRPRRT